MRASEHGPPSSRSRGTVGEETRSSALSGEVWVRMQVYSMYKLLDDACIYSRSRSPLRAGSNGRFSTLSFQRDLVRPPSPNRSRSCARRSRCQRSKCEGAREGAREGENDRGGGGEGGGGGRARGTSATHESFEPGHELPVRAARPDRVVAVGEHAEAEAAAGTSRQVGQPRRARRSRRVRRSRSGRTMRRSKSSELEGRGEEQEEDKDGDVPDVREREAVEEVGRVLEVHVVVARAARDEVQGQ